MYECNICYEKYNNKTNIPIIFISCGHTICSKCVYNLYFYKYNNCPLCKKYITSMDINIIISELINNITIHDLKQILINLKNQKLRVVLYKELYKYSNPSNREQ